MVARAARLLTCPGCRNWGCYAEMIQMLNVAEIAQRCLGGQTEMLTCSSRATVFGRLLRVDVGFLSVPHVLSRLFLFSHGKWQKVLETFILCFF